MATISTPNDPNRNVTTANAAPQEQQSAISTSGAPTPSGRFSTLQKYLQANQGAGQRIAGMIGGNLSQESQRLKDVTGREIDEAQGANRQFGQLTDTTKGFTQQLSQPVQGPSQTVNGKAFDVGSYQANLSGMQAAKDISADENKFKQFSGIRTGDIAKQRELESRRQSEEAEKAAEEAYKNNVRRQLQLQQNEGRNQLITQALNTRNQRAGIQNLDNAFLTQDKTKALNALSSNLAKDVGTLRSTIDTSKLSGAEIENLKKAQEEARTGLTGRLSSMEKEYQDLLNQRVAQINEAKAKRIAAQDEQWKRLQAGQEIQEKFAEELGLQNVLAANPGARAGDVGISMGMDPRTGKTPYEGVRLFNTIKDQDLNTFLDRSLLNRRAASANEVLNQADIDSLSILNRLAGGPETVRQVSEFSGNQTNTMQDKLANALNQRALDFQTKDMFKGFTGEGSGSRDIIKRNWYGGKDKVGTAYGSSVAATNLADYLNQGDIYRLTRGEEKSGGIANLVNTIKNTLTNPLGGIANIIATGPEQFTDAGKAAALIANPTNFADPKSILAGAQFAGALNAELQNQREGITGSGLKSGGLGSAYYGDKDKGAAMTQAERQAVSSVKSQADQYLKDINYDSLLKIARGDY